VNLPDDLDPGAILEALDRHDVAYVVIGGLAAQLHGARIDRTLDVDITPSRDPDNLVRLLAALREVHAKLRPPGAEDGVDVDLDERFFRTMISVALITPHGPLAVALIPDGTTGYEDLVRNRIVVHEFGIGVPVAGLEDIIHSKEAAGRPKDIVHLPILRERLLELGGP
jgi:hypothetical protein